MNTRFDFERTNTHIRLYLDIHAEFIKMSLPAKKMILLFLLLQITYTHSYTHTHRHTIYTESKHGYTTQIHSAIREYTK